MVENENQLAGLACALLDTNASLTKSEQRLRSSREIVPKKLVTTVRKAIKAGDDPLGTLYCQLRSREKRREVGATYTPPAIVASMIAWAQRLPEAPTRIVDPGSGSGRFLIAAARAFPDAKLLAVETDPLALLLLRANAAVNGFVDRLSVKAVDYRRIRLPKIKGRTLFIGNPPYVRHHGISNHWKDWFARAAAEIGFRASKLAGLHIHFFLKTRLIGSRGDYGAFITAGEWIDVNYGSVLREMLSDGLGGASLHIIDPAAQPFSDALTTGAITCFQVGNRPENFAVNRVSDLDDLMDLSNGDPIEWDALENSARWSIHVRKGGKPRVGDIELGELFRVHRGQVTGANRVWINSKDTPPVPRRFLFPTVTKARELINAESILSDPSELRHVIDLPTSLSGLSTKERKQIDSFLEWADDQDVQSGYVAQNRRAWWSVGLRAPAPILCTYMARRAPVFVRNECAARHLNIAHGLYPREELSEEKLLQILAYLNGNVCVSDGRVYAGGLAKFEPREVERLALPSFERLAEQAAQ